MQPKKLKVDLEELGWAFEDHNGEVGWYLDTKTGDVLQLLDELDDEELPIPREQIEEDTTGRFLPVEPEDSNEGYRDMEAFIATVSSAGLRELIEVAISGAGAFRRFKDVLARDPRERERWFQFKQDRLNSRIREWLAIHGIEPLAS